MERKSNVSGKIVTWNDDAGKCVCCISQTPSSQLKERWMDTLAHSLYSPVDARLLPPVVEVASVMYVDAADDSAPRLLDDG